MKKEHMYSVIITIIIMATLIMTMNTVMDTLKHKDEADCFSKTRDIRCYSDNRWEKSHK